MYSDLMCQERLFKRITGRYVLTFTEVSACRFNAQMPCNGLHCHDCFEICLVTGGRGIYREDREFPIEENSVFVGRPFIRHEILLRDCQQLHISYLSFSISPVASAGEPTREDRILEAFLSGSSRVCHGQRHLSVYPGMLEKYLLLGGDYGEEQLVYTMLLDMLSSVGSPGPIRQQDVRQQVDGYIYRHMGEKISLEQLCQCSGLSERSLFYYFKKHMGITPNNYVLAVKISASLGALRMKLPLKAVAEQFGFSDASGYCRCFRRLRGTTPMAYLARFRPGDSRY